MNSCIQARSNGYFEMHLSCAIGEIRISRCYFVGCVNGNDVGGGAIYSNNWDSLELTRSTFIDCYSGGVGGAVAFDNGNRWYQPAIISQNCFRKCSNFRENSGGTMFLCANVSVTLDSAFDTNSGHGSISFRYGESRGKEINTTYVTCKFSGFFIYITNQISVKISFSLFTQAHQKESGFNLFISQSITNFSKCNLIDNNNVSTPLISPTQQICFNECVFIRTNQTVGSPARVFFTECILDSDYFEGLSLGSAGYSIASDPAANALMISPHCPSKFTTVFTRQTSRVSILAVVLLTQSTMA